MLQLLNCNNATQQTFHHAEQRAYINQKAVLKNAVQRNADFRNADLKNADLKNGSARRPCWLLPCDARLRAS
ncbi:pentapeptide repeat-containing protein [Vreelandella titanicae]|uniref:pentapeptide repeat-containing protein n=1 Tax=Halomonadaceae TaxID=28256 RepID=UPI000A054234|nr:pentapeptide repeat-containing protein [Halomonas titanicae]